MEKQFKHGMVLGKFMPPHNGHLFLINYALNHCDILEVFVCSLKSEPIEGKLRYEWLSEIYKGLDFINIHWVQDENPQTPEEHADFDDFYRIWCNTVYSRTSDLDVIFTSEDYGFEFANRLGIEHRLVDIKRDTVPVSGTAIRNNPFKNWQYIPRIVKPYFKKKIAIMGPESTGKSTLTKKLAKYYNGDLIEEYGREYTDDKPAKNLDVFDFEQIAEEQSHRVKEVIANGKATTIFVDTEALITYSFGLMYMGNKFSSKLITKLIHDQDFDLTILCNVDVPWVDDGTRDFKNHRSIHFNMIKFLLDLYGKPYVVINGDDYEDRFNQAKNEINKLIHY
jgi:NadR type nicotinamide-nucleotide adenylyltransferase